MNIERILANNVSIIIGQTNTGKTMMLADLMCQFIKDYTSTVYCYGIKPAITEEIPVITFSSVRELETIQNGIIIIDEVGSLFDLDNRKQKRMIENTLRLVNHHNNRLILSGLPTDFRKFLSAKATCFMYKSITISDLINGSLAKSTLLEYSGSELGAYVLSVPVDTVLCYDPSRLPGFWTEKIRYYKRFDTKLGNQNLFTKRS